MPTLKVCELQETSTVNHVLNLDFVREQSIDYAVVADKDFSNVLS
jgi:hypothetical protein